MENNAKLGSEEQSKNNVTNNNTTSCETQQEQEQNRVNLDSSANDDNNNGEEVGEEATQQPQSQPSRRTPFTNLSQVDADLALARTLQEQERAYMMLGFGNDGSDYGSWEAGSYLHDDEDDFGDPDDESDGDDDDDDDDEEDEDGVEVADGMDALDVHAHDEDAGADDDAGIDVDLDPSMFSSDEAYARALQDAEEREMTARLLALAGINEREVEDMEDRGGGNSQDEWEDIDPDELSYEELIALGEVVGSESRGLSADTIASLPSVNYKAGNSQNGTNDSCVICRLDYDDGETLTVLSCKHSYHSECINDWLKINKVCPVCSTEVST